MRPDAAPLRGGGADGDCRPRACQLGQLQLGGRIQPIVRTDSVPPLAESINTGLHQTQCRPSSARSERRCEYLR